MNGGGNLIAMRPDSNLAGLLGLTAAAGTLANGYLKVDTATGPGAGIVAETMQFHGTADRYTLTGAPRRSPRCTPTRPRRTTNPAVTLRNVGTNGGQAAAFTFDLPASIVRPGRATRPGRARSATARRPIRSDDMFFGGSLDRLGQPRPRWRSRRPTSSSGCWPT